MLQPRIVVANRRHRTFAIRSPMASPITCKWYDARRWYDRKIRPGWHLPRALVWNPS